MELTEQYKTDNYILPEDAQRIAFWMTKGWTEPSRNTLSGRLGGRCPKSGLIDLWPELPNLRRVQWVNWREQIQAMDSDRGCHHHLTLAEGLTGKTLCGRAFPAYKGGPSPLAGRWCKRCLNLAKKRGFDQAMIDRVESVGSKHYLDG